MNLIGCLRESNSSGRIVIRLCERHNNAAAALSFFADKFYIEEDDSAGHDHAVGDIEDGPGVEGRKPEIEFQKIADAPVKDAVVNVARGSGYDKSQRQKFVFVGLLYKKIEHHREDDKTQGKEKQIISPRHTESYAGVADAGQAEKISEHRAVFAQPEVFPDYEF